MIVPYQKISADALRNLVEDFVTREGTDYGNIEATLESKIEHVMRQLKNGDIMVVYNADEDQCNIITKETAHAILEK